MKILAIEHDSPYGHFLLGLLQITGGIAKKSLYHFKKVLDKESDHVNALAWTSGIGAYLGKTDIVEKAISRLSKIDYFYDKDYKLPEGTGLMIPKKGLIELNKFLDAGTGSDGI